MGCVLEEGGGGVESFLNRLVVRCVPLVGVIFPGEKIRNRNKTVHDLQNYGLNFY